jgi:hypothetical protein
LDWEQDRQDKKAWIGDMMEKGLAG